MTIKFSKDVRTNEDIVAWQERLNREWPERTDVAQHLVQQVLALKVTSPCVVELACGAGFLAGWLLRTLPQVLYIGLDRSPYLLDHARRKLAVLASQLDRTVEIHLREADLNEDGWTEGLRTSVAQEIDAVLSLQSIHDFGDEAAQARVIAQVFELLKPGGAFIYADLLLDGDNPHPRRLPVARHLTLLREAGFVSVDCTMQRGELGAFLALKPNAAASAT